MTGGDIQSTYSDITSAASSNNYSGGFPRKQDVGSIISYTEEFGNGSVLVHGSF